MVLTGLGLFRMKLRIKWWLKSAIHVSEAVRCKVTRDNFKTLVDFATENLTAKPKWKWYHNDPFYMGAWNFQQRWKALCCNVLQFHSRADIVYLGLSSAIGTRESGFRLQLYRGLVKWEIISYSFADTWEVLRKDGVSQCHMLAQKKERKILTGLRDGPGTIH